jgi:hydrogenase maturation protein HypF
MTMPALREISECASTRAEIRVRGRVQGVGFRPTVWRLANELRLAGEVLNDGDGVLIRVAGDESAIARLIARLGAEAPPLARIDEIGRRALGRDLAPGFRIVESDGGAPRTEITPDAAICAQCAAEILAPTERRFRYAFATCTHCGPRFSIVTSVPYDRAATTMAGFALCAACHDDYTNPGDRRFHAEATACHACGPRPRLVRCDGRAVTFESFSMLDDCDAVCTLLQRGHIVAIKGIGGYQLACDATNAEAVARLRHAKRRASKPFALMARDLDVIQRYCPLHDEEARQLTSAAGPIVLLRAAGERVSQDVAPGLATLGVMLPNTPLHVLMLRRMNRPVVMTSGNLSDAPQIIDDGEALAKLGGIAEFALIHDRPIATRLDDSVVRIMDGTARLLRRGRGYAPAAITLPPGFTDAPDLVAAGADLKAAFCLLANGKAVLSQHIGDLDEAATSDDYVRNLDHFTTLYDHRPVAVAADGHPDYRSAKLARQRASDAGLTLIDVQHHHAHLAACLAENGRPLGASPVLGIVLDGLGWGADGTLWGGEFLLGDYRSVHRLATIKPVALLGGDAAAREPWRNLYAHLMAGMGWGEFSMNFGALEIYRVLAGKPRATLDAMIRAGTNAPKASSCGRLFDAVAAAVGICCERQGYEGEAAARLEALVSVPAMQDEDEALAYPFTIPNLPGSELPYIEPLAMWRALLGDLVLETPVPVIAARFHKGLANAIVAMARKLAAGTEDGPPRFDTVALSGGCFQNAILLDATASRLRAAGFAVLAHAAVPSNDGGLALGQAVIAAAKLMCIPGG